MLAPSPVLDLAICVDIARANVQRGEQRYRLWQRTLAEDLSGAIYTHHDPPPSYQQAFEGRKRIMSQQLFLKEDCIIPWSSTFRFTQERSR